jgi:biotin carboxyl carrier protein
MTPGSDPFDIPLIARRQEIVDPERPWHGLAQLEILTDSLTNGMNDRKDHRRRCEQRATIDPPRTTRTCRRGRQSHAEGKGALPRPNQQEPGNTSMAAKQILSPLPGTFYRQPSPGEPPFKDVGDEVKEGDVIGLVEVMKVFSEVKAEIAGKIASFLVENEEPVMAGAPLVELEG